MTGSASRRRPAALGALVLGLLSGIAFRGRFVLLSTVQRGMFVTSAVLAALAPALLLAPAAYLRMVPGQRPAGQAMRVVNSMAAGAGTATLFTAASLVLPQLLSGESPKNRNGPDHPARGRLTDARHGPGRCRDVCSPPGRCTGSGTAVPVVLAVGHQLAAAGGPNAEGWPQAGELGLALLLPAVIGVARKTRQKSAGLRTCTLVGVGSAVFMLISKYGSGDVLQPGRVVVDPSRVAAQIATGALG